MNAVGIICEYNPFHLGHARMLEGLRALGTPILLVSHEEPVLAACDAVYAFDGPPLRKL